MSYRVEWETKVGINVKYYKTYIWAKKFASKKRVPVYLDSNPITLGDYMSTEESRFRRDEK